MTDMGVQRGDRRARILAIAQHEWRAASRTKMLGFLIVVLMAASTLSVLVAAAAHRAEVLDYRNYVDAAVAGGVTRVAPSPLRPLSLLRAPIEYLAVIGSIIAITFGHLSVARERTNRTQMLVAMRPVSTGERLVGTMLGASSVFTLLTLTSLITGVVAAGAVGGDWVGLPELGRVVLTLIATVIYMLVFYVVGNVATARSRVAATGLFIALLIWLVVVLVLPQVGDTLDADNQVPGGLFSALGLDRADESTILARFSGYETTRIGLEEASFEKHYERFSFAMADVLLKYRDFTLRQLLVEKWHDIVWMLTYPVAALSLFWLALRDNRTFTTTQGDS